MNEIKLTKAEVEAILQSLSVMPYNQVANIIQFLGAKLNAPQVEEVKEEVKK